MGADNDFEKVMAEAETWYESVDGVYCPYFKETIAFNAKGLKHLKFEKDDVARNRADQYMRLKYIKYAYRILEKTRTLQEYREGNIFEEVKSNKRREKVLQKVSYYGFVAVVSTPAGLRRFKVVVKQVAGGSKYFWSIVPLWKNNKQLHSGNLEED